MGGPLSYRNQSIDLEWTGFYMITASIMKELNAKVLLKNLIKFCRRDYVLSIAHDYQFLWWSLVLFEAEKPSHIYHKIHLSFWLFLFRSSCPQLFFKIGVLKNFSNFIGRRLCWSFFLIKFQGFQACNFI